MPDTIHLEKGIPKYIQIGQWVTDMIQKGRLAVHDQLPSEARLAELFDVNRNTIRQAISDLVAKGLVQKRNGVGTFVLARGVQPVKYTLQHISSFTDDMDRMGVTPLTRLIKKGGVEAPPEVAAKLMLGKDRQAVLIERVRLGNGIPLVIERSYLPYREYRALLKMRLTGSLYHLLVRRFQVDLARSIQTFRAILLTRRDAQLLRVPPSSPGIFLESIIYDSRNIPVEVLHAYHRGDKYVFEVESGRYRYDLEEVNGP
jgi:GntR family transcriptional regulator